MALPLSFSSGGMTRARVTDLCTSIRRMARMLTNLRMGWCWPGSRRGGYSNAKLMNSSRTWMLPGHRYGPAIFAGADRFSPSPAIASASEPFTIHSAGATCCRWDLTTRAAGESLTRRNPGAPGARPSLRAPGGLAIPTIIAFRPNGSATAGRRWSWSSPAGSITAPSTMPSVCGVSIWKSHHEPGRHRLRSRGQGQVGCSRAYDFGA